MDNIDRRVSVVNDEGRVRNFYVLRDEIFEHAIGFHNGNVSKAAKQLGVGRSTMNRWLGGR